MVTQTSLKVTKNVFKGKESTGTVLQLFLETEMHSLVQHRVSFN